MHLCRAEETSPSSLCTQGPLWLIGVRCPRGSPPASNPAAVTGACLCVPGPHSSSLWRAACGWASFTRRTLARAAGSGLRLSVLRFRSSLENFLLLFCGAVRTVEFSSILPLEKDSNSILYSSPPKEILNFGGRAVRGVLLCLISNPFSDKQTKLIIIIIAGRGRGGDPWPWKR